MTNTPLKGDGSVRCCDNGDMDEKHECLTPTPQRGEEILFPIHVYKTPLKVTSGGFGFDGVLLQTADGEKIQCHFCGKLYRSLSSHVILAHDITAKEYRKKFGLMHNTALVSDVERVVRVDRMNKMRDEGFTSGGNLKKALAAAVKATKGRKYVMTLEVKNKRGSCPDQILDKILQFHREQGHTPTKYEFEDAYSWGKRYIRLAERTFGTWGKAVALCKLPKVEHKIVNNTVRWADEEILDMIKLFSHEEQRRPMFSDFRRGYLPHPATVSRRFGTLEKARQLANV